MSEGFIFKAYKSFRRCVDWIIEKNGGHTEKNYYFVSLFLFCCLFFFKLKLILFHNRVIHYYTRRSLIFSSALFIYIYIYIYIYIRGAFNKSPDFFVHAFKIVVDFWKFSMLLLYIIWDDWPFFMISDSNEHLQQELKLSQLKNFKNAIWTWGHFRRTICKKVLFETWKQCHRNLWNASDYLWTTLHESSISFWVV